MRIAPDGLPIEAPLENSDWVETKSGSYLHQGSIFFHNLKVPKPNPIVKDGEGKDVVNERLAFRVMTRGSKNLNKQFLQQLVVGILVKGRVK